MSNSLLKPLVASLLISVSLIGCGGSSSGGGVGTGTATAINGTASAPNGMVAQFESAGPMLAVLDFVVGKATATITGLMPINGATVELIRIDNNGVQAGAVIATTTTSITGNYTLNVPAGTNLSADLVVRITGTGGTTMSAQVVDTTVNISPVSEFILQNFIDNGADLANLTTASVVQLSGQVDAFDLTATADLTSMLAALEQLAGNLVDEQIDLITATPGNAASVAGNYRLAGHAHALHDNDAGDAGSFNVDVCNLNDISLTDGGNGAVNFTINGEECVFGGQQNFSGGSTVTREVDINIGMDTLVAQLDDQNILRITSEFEENIDTNIGFGWRDLPHTTQLQKAMNTDVFFGLSENVSLRFELTNGAVDPSKKHGDEVFRELIIAAKKPTNASVASLNGDYGHVYFGTRLIAGGVTELENHSNIISFNGSGMLDVAVTTTFNLSRSGLTQVAEAAEIGITYTVSADGDIPTTGSANANGFINADGTFIVFNESDFVDDANPSDNLVNEIALDLELFVKLPGSQLDISNKRYRLILKTILLEPTNTNILTSKFDSTLTINNDGMTGTLVFGDRDVEQIGLLGQVSVNQANNLVTFNNLPITVAANGATTFTVTDGTEITTFTGYLSQDGSIGVFRVAVSSMGSTSDLGIAVLLEY